MRIIFLLGSLTCLAHSDKSGDEDIGPAWGDETTWGDLVADDDNDLECGYDYESDIIVSSGLAPETIDLPQKPNPYEDHFFPTVYVKGIGYK